ncbi:hypothetical protein GCM10010911_63840 [Paenibacillus nasutitermitis]|uniref:HTH merR-type domain-containing protein n=1 Tax=Paenibacillus nasutitermitis TaxID=1652958 RepID=A0A916ZH08_9BACL|nr:hypothetical protein GCM10010911_63840 [Paenibacillus nasutitermitis]
MKPTINKENGYRYYDQEALEKLQTILSLKSIGYTLIQIKELFESSRDLDVKIEGAWVKSIQKQLNYVAVEVEKLKRKQFILRGMLQTIEMSGKYNQEHIFLLMNQIESSHFVDGAIPATFPTTIFSEEEINILNQLPLIGSDDPRIHTTLDLIRETRESMHVHPGTPEAQKLANKWYRLTLSWFNGNSVLQNKYFSFIAKEAESSSVIYGWDQKLIDFIDNIINHLDNEEEGRLN